MKVYYWCPFISYVATTLSVLNSIKSINKFSKKKINCKIINAANEWKNYLNDIKENNIDIINLNNKINFEHLPKGGFFKSRFTYIIIFLFSIRKLHLLLKKEEPEYLIIHLLTFIPMLLLFCFNYKTKFILRISGYPKLNIFRRILWSSLNKKIYKVFCPTEITKNILIKEKIFSVEKLSVLHDPILNIKEINKYKKKKLETSLPKKYVISIGRLTKQKNYQFLINGFNNILKTHSDIKLIILGEGEERKKLESLINSLERKKEIFLLGHKDNIYPYLSDSLFFVLTSDWEDPGFVILESMYKNKIVFSSNCPSGPEDIIVNGENGFLYEKGNLEDFENQFIKVYEHIKNDKIKIESIKISAKKKTKEFTLYCHYKNIIEYLN